MKISMIMGTLNRRNLMERAIESILVQSHADFEIVIVDQSDETNEDIALWDDRIKYTHINERGLSLARNIGLKMASGDIIGLMDDDAVYEQNVLEIVSKLFDANNKIGIVCGQIIDFNNLDEVLDGHPKLLNQINFFKYCISPSMFIRKQTISEINFDEVLGVGRYLGSAEESDMVLQIMYKKMKGVYAPNIHVYHAMQNGRADIPKIDLNKHRSYCRGYGAFCAKHIYKYKNFNIIWLYSYSMIRTFGGYCLSILKKDSYLKMFYMETLKSRKEGFGIYRNKLKVKKNDT